VVLVLAVVIEVLVVRGRCNNYNNIRSLVVEKFLLGVLLLSLSIYIHPSIDRAIDREELSLARSAGFVERRATASKTRSSVWWQREIQPT